MVGDRFELGALEDVVERGEEVAVSRGLVVDGQVPILLGDVGLIVVDGFWDRWRDFWWARLAMADSAWDYISEMAELFSKGRRGRGSLWSRL